MTMRHFVAGIFIFQMAASPLGYAQAPDDPDAATPAAAADLKTPPVIDPPTINAGIPKAIKTGKNKSPSKCASTIMPDKLLGVFYRAQDKEGMSIIEKYMKDPANQAAQCSAL